MKLHVEWTILLQTSWSTETWLPGTACECALLLKSQGVSSSSG